MRKFNPEKELYKIKYGKRNKIILGIILLLVTISIGSTFALYQVRHSKRIIYTTVDDFSNNKDIILSVYLDDKEDNKFPEKNTGYIYLKTECENNKDNHVKAYFNSATWTLEIEANNKTKCDIYFITSKKYQDQSGANSPELYQGLIPVKYSEDGRIYVANPEEEWYDYDKKEWANAVLVNASDDTIKRKYFNDDNTLNNNAYGQEIPMNEILQMYVWIPRYKYQLFNVNGQISEQMINIKFEHGTESTGEVICKIDENGKETCENAINGNWYTHPAFQFGNTKLYGIWVGKFDISDPTTQGKPSATSLNEITILPNKLTAPKRNPKIYFDAGRNIEAQGNKYNLNPDEVDTHMMKNMEWGAIAYLTNSVYGLCDNSGNCQQIYINNTNSINAEFDSNGSVTGCSAQNVSSSVKQPVTACESGRSWEKAGKEASTTKNLYGIYDLAGGSYTYVMAFMKNNGTFIVGNTGFKNESFPASKYYDIYEYLKATSSNTSRGHLGDATKEVMKTTTTITCNTGSNNNCNGWYKNKNNLLVADGSPIIGRGETFKSKSDSGIMAVTGSGGAGTYSAATSYVLTAQDGED